MLFILVVILLNFNYFNVIFSNSEINFFHDFNCYLLVYVIIFIIFSYLFMLINFFQKINLNYKLVEFKCCFIPFIILIIQLIPRLFLFFEVVFFLEDYLLTVKVIGHQWYWSYEYRDFLGYEFDSYMKEIEYVFLSNELFLDVDNRLVLPRNLLIRFVATSSDVIHAWVLPNFFLKIDVMTGVIRVLNYNFEILGIFYGQCSEICGVNHSFIPIIIEVVLFDFFKNYV